jgi:integrase
VRLKGSAGGVRCGSAAGSGPQPRLWGRAMRLTVREIERLECPPGKKDMLVFDDERRGLAVRVMKSANKGSLDWKTYVAQYTVAGRKRRVPLGAASGISLDAARKATAAILGEVAQGRDPAAARAEARREAEREAARELLTLDELLRQWEALRLAERRESYAAEAVRAVRFAFAKQSNKPAADLTRETVVRVLDKLSGAGKNAMASRTAAYGRACYAWAIKRGSIAANPFDHLPLEPVEKRERVLTDDELRAIWRATDGPSSFDAIVRALIVTGQRREEVAQMAWSEIAADRTAWTLPAERAKNSVAHIVPLSPQMQAHLVAFEAKRKELEAKTRRKEEETTHGNKTKTTDLVFPGRDGPFNGFGKAKAALDEACGVKDWRLHDLRRTVATGLQKLGVRLEVTEAVLNHVSGSRAGIVGVYQRHDYAAEKRAALSAWGNHVAAIVEGRPAEGNVTSIRRGAVA